MQHASTAGARPETRRVRGAAALAALAAWAVAVPWLARAAGAELDVPATVEVLDHVLPGAVALACSAVLWTRRGRPPESLASLGAAGVAALAGFWVTATHAVLLPEAIDGIAPWGAALLHLSAGPPVTVLALWMLLAGAGR